MTKLKNTISNDNIILNQQHNSNEHPLFQTTTTTSKIEIKPGLKDIPLPKTIHTTIQTTSRVIIIGDVHGCLTELKNLLQKCNVTPTQDTIILVGDLMSKGPHPLDTLRFIQENGIYCVRGNHDDAALKAYYELKCLEEDEDEDDDDVTKDKRFDRRREIMRKYGYTMEFTPEDVGFLESLPFTIYLPFYDSIVVHAGLGMCIPSHHITL